MSESDTDEDVSLSTLRRRSESDTDEDVSLSTLRRRSRRGHIQSEYARLTKRTRLAIFAEADAAHVASDQRQQRRSTSQDAARQRNLLNMYANERLRGGVRVEGMPLLKEFEAAVSAPPPLTS